MDDKDFQGMPDDNINIGDVMEVIETDPDYSNRTQRMAAGPQQGGYKNAAPRCVIVEEPAQKQLRFRYECEGRSAGSIPGANSTPDNKTYPTIKVEGYKGKAVVVVSCVTKDQPFRPHPHKLVGREGCKRGVCTVHIPEDTMTVSFQNLGVQCVKKKEIEDALRAREEIRVDPFLTGFAHRNSPTSIDLNAVRLCFQVFLHTEGKKDFTNLPPIVSNPIYDKKAMSDLVIVKLSDCVCPVDGGNKDIILLCEKVAKEDIQVRFFEEQNGQLLWEGFGEFQPAQVHKQTAIWFRPPRYKTLEVIDPVKMFIQLRRPSDGATSAPVPFQMVSLGRPASWSLRPMAKKRNYSIFNEILAQDVRSQNQRRASILKCLSNINNNDAVSVETQTLIENNNNNIEKNNNEDVIESLSLDKVIVDVEERMSENDPKEIFDDNKSYTSLQLAFKNPFDIIVEDKYEDVIVVPESPKISVLDSPKPEEPVAEKLPPLPPKRLKKGDIRTYSSKITDINDPSSDIKIDTSPPLPMRSKSLSRQELNPLPKDLPPTPCSTLPKSKKRKFLSGIFSHFNKSGTVSRESTPTINYPSSNSLQTNTINSNISLLQSETNKDVNLNVNDSENTIDDSNQKKIDSPDELNLFNDLDLTEAENYALYMTMPPFATQSEFDEASCYYAPVEGKRRAESADHTPNKKIFTELHSRVKNTPLPEMDFAQQLNIPIQPMVKDEPRDLLRSPYQYVDQLSQSPQHYPQMSYNTSPVMPSTSGIVQQLDAIHYNVQPPPRYTMDLTDNAHRNVEYVRNDLNPIVIEPGDLGLNEIAQNLSSSLSLTDLGADGMTDSLDRLANNEFDRHLAQQLNNQ